MTREQYETRWKDYYEVLQVHANAEQPVISAAFRKLAQLYHPDRNKNADATDRFKEINEAHEVLSNPARRSTYDAVSRTRHNRRELTVKAVYDEFVGFQRDVRRPTASSTYENTQRVERTYQRDQRPGSHSKGFFADLAETKLPDPDETQRILPWPSWTWQRFCLIGAVPLGLLVLVVSVSGALWGGLICGLLLLTGATYAGVATGWLRRSQEAPAAARITGGACILVSGITYVAVGVGVVLYVRFMILGMKVAASMVADWWEREMK